MEDGFECLQRSVGPGHIENECRDVIAAAVGTPHAVLIGTGDLPGYVVSARSLHRANWRPGPKLTRRDDGAAKLQRWARPAGVEVIAISSLHHAGAIANT